MENLLLGDILKIVINLQEKGMTSEEICNTPIYLGNDDELNGIHTGWSCDVLPVGSTDTNKLWLRKMITEDSHNVPLPEDAVAILIS